MLSKLESINEFKKLRHSRSSPEHNTPPHNHSSEMCNECYCSTISSLCHTNHHQSSLLRLLSSFLECAMPHTDYHVGMIQFPVVAVCLPLAHSHLRVSRIFLHSEWHTHHSPVCVSQQTIPCQVIFLCMSSFMSKNIKNW